MTDVTVGKAFEETTQVCAGQSGCVLCVGACVVSVNPDQISCCQVFVITETLASEDRSDVQTLNAGMWQ